MSQSQALSLATLRTDRRGGKLFGSDYGPVPYGVKEHVQIVEDVLPSRAERQQVFWKTSNRIFRLRLADTDLMAPAVLSVVA
jgi:hypothetical protein